LGGLKQQGPCKLKVACPSPPGNQGLENAIFRSQRTENKELRSLFSVPEDGNQGLENAIFRPWKAENKDRTYRRDGGLSLKAHTHKRVQVVA